MCIRDRIVIITAGNNFIKQRQFLKLNAKKDEVYYLCCRDSVVQQVHVKDIVVGDVLLLNIGDIIPCDGVLFEGQDIEVDESSLTGEPELIKKNIFQSSFLQPVNCFMISGSKLMDGTGKMLVCAVGPNSQLCLLYTSPSPRDQA
eukprot:TRINITY_DN11045_c0_g1_i1.p1 TRINITY_DN11045_c0_g1~~TRINITY_DN11045_c0_g1_i1.p1  ORF type:complete len:145 (-),score=16.99 TRINITY_DN11045_c0_g1_i1:69-503(-)